MLTLMTPSTPYSATSSGNAFEHFGFLWMSPQFYY
jgi:hypothetical protein